MDTIYENIINSKYQIGDILAYNNGIRHYVVEDVIYSHLSNGIMYRLRNICENEFQFYSKIFVEEEFNFIEHAYSVN